MKSGTMSYRVVARKLQAASKAVQFVLVAGFSPQLTQAKADYYETLSPSSTLQKSEIDDKVAAFAKLSNAADVQDVTDDATAKKLAKLWDNGDSDDMLFSRLGIASYM